MAEAKVKARAKGEGKAKAEKEERKLGVKQNLGSIMQKNTFVGDDVRPLEIEGEDVPDVSVDGESDDEAEGEEVEGAEDAVAELGWNDVFKGDEPQEPLTVFTRADDDDEEEVNDAEGMPIVLCSGYYELICTCPDDSAASEADSESAPQKETRMKTNKVRTLCFPPTHVDLTNLSHTEKSGELLLQGQRQEQESSEVCLDEVVAEERPRTQKIMRVVICSCVDIVSLRIQVGSTILLYTCVVSEYQQ